MKIALLGYGVVARGTHKALKELRPDIEIKKVLEIRDVPELGDLKATDFNEIVNDPEIELVAEIIGGIHPAYEFVKASLEAGKHVVTPNKQMLSLYYKELLGIAKAHNVSLAFSATVGGGIPWLVNVIRYKAVDEILSVSGVMNGTTNYILDNMMNNGMSFDDALKQAQALGYAEANPEADVMGYDVRAKISISASVAWNTVVDPMTVPTVGITEITIDDIKAAQAEGKVIRLIGKAWKEDGQVKAEVKPQLVTPEDAEYILPGPTNCITMDLRRGGKFSFRGAGAGGDATGNNMAADIISIADKNCPFDIVRDSL